MTASRLCMPVLIICCLLIFPAVEMSAAEPDQAPPHKDKCPVCGMFVAMFVDWNAKIEFDDATQAIFDGPKDMFKYYLNIEKHNPSKGKNNITAIYVKDYYSKTDIIADSAFYVIWSNVYGPMGHEPVPFEKEADARKFKNEHKGRKILRFKEITAVVIKSLDNP